MAWIYALIVETILIALIYLIFVVGADNANAGAFGFVFVTIAAVFLYGGTGLIFVVTKALVWFMGQGSL